MNKKQLINAINEYPHLNEKQRDILIYFVLMSLDIKDMSHSISTTTSYLANITKMTVNQAWRAVEALKKKKLVIEINGYKHKVYKLNEQELKKIIIHAEVKIIAQELQKK